MTMIKLTNSDGTGRAVWVSAEQVLSVHEGDTCTSILFAGGSYVSVAESAEDVARMLASELRRGVPVPEVVE